MKGTGVSQFFLACATLSARADVAKAVLNAYLVFTTECDDQSMGKSVSVISFPRSSDIADPGGTVDMGNWA